MVLYTLLQEENGGFQLSEAARQFVQFLGWFGIFGPIGFRYVVMRRGPASPDRELAALDEVRERSLAGAALIGLGGALLLVVSLLPLNGRNTVSVICGAVLFVAYAVARRGSSAAWLLAVLAGIVLVFQSIVRLRWATLVNPIHMTAAAFWIGSLFVLVSAGLPPVLRAPIGTRRGPLVAELIARFSPMALFSSGLLVLTGLTTAWRHLGTFSALWSTPYGITLIVKLCFVGAVVALGAWNWRRMSPLLGTEETAHAIRRSATAEVSVTVAVLVITAILVSLPAPAEQAARVRSRAGVPPGPASPTRPVLVPSAGAPAPAPGATRQPQAPTGGTTTGGADRD